MSNFEVLERLLLQHPTLTNSEIYSCLVFVCDHHADVRKHLERWPQIDHEIEEEWNDDDFLARYYRFQGYDLLEAYQDNQDDSLFEAA